MMLLRLPMVIAVAGAEIRTTYRLSRYWLFAILCLLVTFFVSLQINMLHQNSGIASGFGGFSPRYFVGLSGEYFFVVFLPGWFFSHSTFVLETNEMEWLMYWIRAPQTNGELLLGKTLALVFLTWLPFVGVALLLQSLGTVFNLLGLPPADTVEAYSLIGFVFYGLTTMSLWCSFLVLITILCRYRTVVLAIVFTVLGIQYWLSRRYLPPYLTTVLTMSPGLDIASDILPRLFRPGSWIRLLSYWVMATGLLAVAVSLHPRRDGQSRTLIGLVGAGFLVLASALVGLYYWDQTSDFRKQTAWLDAHTEKSAHPRDDLQSVSGTLAIVPGEEIRLRLELQVDLRAARKSLLFTLNPGLTVDQVFVSGNLADFTHRNGLLEITMAELLLYQTSAAGEGAIAVNLWHSRDCRCNQMATR
jgi:hypothetical protein